MKLKEINDLFKHEILDILEKINYKFECNIKLYMPFILTLLNLKNLNILNAFKNILQKKKIHKNISSISIVPCSYYIDNIIFELKKQINNILLIDNYREGKICGIPIIKENDFKTCDLFYISCLTIPLIEYFQKKFEKFSQISLTELYEFLVENDNTELYINNKLINDLLRNNSSKDIYILAEYIGEPLVPTVYSLIDNGFNVKIIIEKDYGIRHGIKISLKELLKHVIICKLSLVDLLVFAEKVRKGQIIFINYSLNTVKELVFIKKIMSFFKVKKGLLLFDVIRPSFKGFKDILSIVYKDKDDNFINMIKDDIIDCDTFWEYSYKNIISKSDFVILNSNTKDTTKFLINCTNQKKICNFFRYSYILNNNYTFNCNKIVNYKDMSEFRIAVINSIFDVYISDEMRLKADLKILKQILGQKIHVHKFSSNENIRLIKKYLNEEEKRFFHGENIILDQKKLLLKLSDFDIGWMVHDSVGIIDAISQTKSQFLKELFYLFGMTTVPTTVITFCAAGLPVLVNRSMKGLMDEFPEFFFIPMELSETVSLRNILEDSKLEERKKKCYKYRYIFSIDYQIKKLILFLTRC